MLMCIKRDYMQKYFIYIFSSKWGKESIVVNVINYGRIMADLLIVRRTIINSSCYLRGNMENPLECQKAYIVEATFTRVYF